MSKKDKQDKAQEYLDKLQQQSSQQKRLQTLKLLNRKKPITSNMFNWFMPLRQKIINEYEYKKKQLIRQIKYSENRHLFIITIFFVGACWVSWSMQDKYDKIRARTNNTKSMKKRQIQQENQHIQRMLNKNPFQPVPIQEEQQANEDYIYKKVDIEFDTRADLLQILEREKGLMKDQEIQKL